MGSIASINFTRVGEVFHSGRNICDTVGGGCSVADASAPRPRWQTDGQTNHTNRWTVPLHKALGVISNWATHKQPQCTNDCNCNVNLCSQSQHTQDRTCILCWINVIRRSQGFPEKVLISISQSVMQCTAAENSQFNWVHVFTVKTLKMHTIGDVRWADCHWWWSASSCWLQCL